MSPVSESCRRSFIRSSQPELVLLPLPRVLAASTERAHRVTPNRAPACCPGPKLHVFAAMVSFGAIEEFLTTSDFSITVRVMATKLSKMGGEGLRRIYTPRTTTG